MVIGSGRLGQKASGFEDRFNFFAVSGGFDNLSAEWAILALLPLETHPSVMPSAFRFLPIKKRITVKAHVQAVV